MAEKSIKIHLVTAANLAAIRAVNAELADMAMQVGRKNDDMRQATMRATREYYSLGDAADKAASRAVLSARQIEEAWRKAMAKPAEAASNASRGFAALTDAAKGAARGIGGAFGSVAGMFLQGGIWSAAAQAVTKLFSWAWSKIGENAEKEAKRAERAWKDGLASVKDGAAAVEEAFSSSMSALDRSISRFDAMTNSVRELTKAEIELAKQQAIASGMDPASANAAAADLSAQVDYDAEENRLLHLIATEKKRVDAAKDAEAKTAEEVAKAAKAKSDAEAEYERKREEYVRKNAETTAYVAGGMGFSMQSVRLSEDRIAENREKASADFEDTDEAVRQREKIRNATEALKGIKTDGKALAAADAAQAKIEQAEDALETLAAERAARELALQNELAAKREESAKKEAAKRTEEEKKSAEKVAAERARLDAQESARRERDRQAELAARIKEHQSLLAAERMEESKTRSAVSAAESKLQRAWGWYRDKDSMAAQLQEEKADAESSKQFEKDFARLKDRRRDWRKADDLSVDEEAVRRVALAREEKEAAEKHLAEIEKNTADLAAKLDELLSVKG